jgi:hypothetical protein
MKRAVAIAVLVTGLASFAGWRAAAPARAVSTQVVACEHLHLTYSYQIRSSFPATVTASDCSNGTAVSTSVSGSGTMTLISVAMDPACIGTVNIACYTFALSLNVAGSTVSPTFNTIGYLNQPVDTGLSQTTLDYTEADTVTSFATGSGSGGFNTICTFVYPNENCTLDGAFTWAVGA